MDFTSFAVVIGDKMNTGVIFEPVSTFRTASKCNKEGLNFFIVANDGKIGFSSDDLSKFPALIARQTYVPIVNVIGSLGNVDAFASQMLVVVAAV